MTWSPVDLSKLPAPTVVEEIDFETIFAERIARLQELTEESGQEYTALVESDPAYKLIQENAYRELTLRQRINEAAKAVMLAFAKGNDLEAVVANYNTQRLVITPADETTSPPTEAVMEQDDSLTERAQQAFEGLSVAGPTAAYERHARSADGRVTDARAISPSPACVTVSILAEDGSEEAPADLITIVEEALSDEDVRPVGDRLTVQSAEIVHYSIRATVYLNAGPEAEPILQAAADAADAYRATKKRIGRNVNRSAISAAIHVTGISKVVLESPAEDIEISDTQGAYCTGVEIINGGVNG